MHVKILLTNLLLQHFDSRVDNGNGLVLILIHFTCAYIKAKTYGLHTSYLYRILNMQYKNLQLFCT